jgi:hypothetical protein
MIDLIRLLNGLALITSSEPGSPVSRASPAAIAQFMSDDF